MMRRPLSLLTVACVALLPAHAATAEPPATTVFFGDPARCPEPVQIRMGPDAEPVALRLLDCDGRAVEDTLRRLTEMGRRGSPDGGGPLLHPALLVRLQRIAERFDGHVVQILGGIRTNGPPTSRHFHGRALDLRVEGIDSAALSELLRELPQTGVGYHADADFVHLDVRERARFWAASAVSLRTADSPK